MERTEVLRLYDHHSNEVYRLAYSYLMNRDDAQDIVQEVFLRLLEKNWCCTIKVDIENSKGQYIEKDKQEATKDGSESTKIQHGI